MSAKRTTRKRQAKAAQRTTKPDGQASARARQLASVVLEVLAGLRSPQEASEAVGLSTQRYYTLEARAIEGLVAALEPRPRGGGRRKSPDKERAELEARCEQLEQELRRAQALVRVARCSIKVPAAPSKKDREKARKTAKAKGKRGPRRPTVRARKLASKLRPSGPDGGDAGAEAGSDDGDAARREAS